MRYVVTGAAGFIGSHLAEALRRGGHEVVGIDCFTDYYDPALKEENARGLDVRRVDLAEDALDFAGFDGVFHLAGQPGVRSFGDVFPLYLRRNVLASQRVFEAAARDGVRVVFASSSSVYGAAERYPTPEDDDAAAALAVRDHQARVRAPRRRVRAASSASTASCSATSTPSARGSGPTWRSRGSSTRSRPGRPFELYGDGDAVAQLDVRRRRRRRDDRGDGARHGHLQRRRCARGVDERGDRAARADLRPHARRAAAARGAGRPAAHEAPTRRGSGRSSAGSRRSRSRRGSRASGNGPRLESRAA